MVIESVLWTLLPNGVDPETGRSRSTVFVSPRLQPDGDADEHGRAPLKAFPSFAHWPSTLERLKLAVEIDGLGVVGAQPIDLLGRPDPALWDLLMRGDVGVGGHAVTEHVDSDVHSFPAHTIAEEILDLYTQVGSTSSTEHPSVLHPALDALADDLGDLGDVAASDDRLRELYRGRRENGTGRHVPADVARADRRTAFRLAYRFYDRRRRGERLRDARGPIDPDAVPPGPDRPLLDFHRYVAAFGDYPELLRRLGLAIDLLHDDEPPELERLDRYRLVVEGDPDPFMTADTARPWTHFRRHDRLFVAAERDGRWESTDGQLRLDDVERWALHQIDVDGSALKTTATAATIQRQQADQAASASTAEETASLPALRSGGMTLVRIGAVDPLVQQLDRTHDLAQTEQAAGEVELWAQDLVRGHRLDVEVDGSGTFWSLCQRVGTFTYHGADGPQPIDVRPDEGYVKGTSTTSVPGDTDLYLHEAVASWNGWSVVAPRPGGGVDEHDEPDEGRTARQRNEAAGKEPFPADLPLEVRFRPRPGTLPPLRFGRSYRMRALTVDLAGNSVDRDTTGIHDEHATQAAPFFRWEPVPPPVVVPRREYGEGESQLRMVIRSTAGTTVGEWLALPRVQALRGVPSGLPYDALDERWLVAPSSSQQLAELHGVFDDAIASGDPARVQAAFEVASRESGQLAPVEAAETLALPYLPDVSSRGVRFDRFFLENGYRKIEWPSDAGAWHDRQPFRVRLVEGPWDDPVVPVGTHQLPTWDAATRVLTVPVPQAEQRTVRLSSAVTEADLDLQGLYPRLMDAAAASPDPNRFAFARGEALESRTWVLTPWIDLTFVHAVEKPLADPVLLVPQSGMTRRTGDTFCVLDGVIQNHAKSSGRLDVEATWTEQVDDVLRDTPEDDANGLPARPAQAHVGDFLLVADEDACQVGRDEKPPVGPGSSKGRVHRLRHELGSTRHRVVTYHARATTRFREYFGPEVTDVPELISRTGPFVQRHVPSSRRPDPPDVAYVVPTTRWSEEWLGPILRRGQRFRGGIEDVALGAVRRTRHGGGLRVYLRRPWYSSGDGELLGVVLTDQPWFTYPIDVGVGMTASVADRLTADEAARRLLETGALEAAGAATASPAERLLRGAGLKASLLKDPSRLDPGVLASTLTSSLEALDRVVPGLVLLPFGLEPGKLVTQTGTDPAFASAGVAPGPLIHHFGLRTAVRTGLTLAETNRARFTVVGHRPEYDPERKMWFCDVDLDAGKAYTPMVRLALTRFQPWSIDDAHLSAVRHADWAQVLPRRSATWRRVGSVVTISVEGPAGVGRLGRGLLGAAGVQASRRMTVRVQSLVAGADPDLGWLDVGPEVELTPTVDRAVGYASVTWTGRVPVPDETAGASWRALVEEHELHPSDPGDPSDVFGDVVAHGVRARLVYADTYTL